MKPVRLTVLTFVLLCRFTFSAAQLTISANTAWTSGNGEPVTLMISGDILINSTDTDLRNCSVYFTGVAQTIETSSPVTLQSFTVDGSDNLRISLKGPWNITNEIVFLNGIMSPDSDGKLVFSGTIQPEGNELSFVDGTFYSKGNGRRFFPIGTQDKYTPAILNNIVDANTVIGITAFSGPAQFSLNGLVTALSQTNYYELNTDNGAIKGSAISLSTNGTDLTNDESSRVVVQSDAIDGKAFFLGGEEERIGFITSTSAPSAKFVAVGITKKIELVIYDLISPFTKDEKNDKLKIANIEFTVLNQVTLFDRWGIVVKSWSNFTNYDDAANPNPDNYDFTKLSPGNYLCIVEYQLAPGASMQKRAQMITLLKSR